MTAPAQHHRLESTGLWRDTPEAQRREVIVSLGDATLMISAPNETAITHWSLPTVTRLNPGRHPALYAPQVGDPEELEIADQEMIDAIETLRDAIERARPHPGRLRLWIGLSAVATLLVLATIWVPGALTRQTLAVLPEVSRAEIGQALLAEMTRIGGQPCTSEAGQTALARLARRSLGPDAAQLVVLPSGIPDTVALPGNVIVLRATLVEDHDSPEVLAGYLLAESARAEAADPVLVLLEQSGLWTTLRLLTSGALPEDAVNAHAARLLSTNRDAVSPDALLPRFAAAELSTQPYAFAQDVSGETTLALIEADPMRNTGTVTPILSDADWLGLQDICMR